LISLIVYGRNDAHGYNLHRRAALSLNCIAEVLTDPDDEIVFVDYNTPDELPTFVEALSDTLTERCLGLLRVLRVPAALHEQRFAGRTHLPVSEPVARNSAVRRGNPANRWLLLTNTDMIFLPRSDQSLSEICGALADGFYGLPRFELPEWLWERLPRSDPERAMAEVARLGPGLRLDETTLSNEWIRFDAPGDFQLVLREDYVAVDGLDEEMALGYHVDSNFSKRMRLYRGSIESLEDSVAGYHCNHNRTPTVYHGAQKVTNDLERFFVLVERPEVPEQRATWGLADHTVEEVPVRERSGVEFAEAVVSAAPDSPGRRTPSDAARVSYELTYDSGHVLPFIADSLAVTPPGATVGYVGANPLLQHSLAALVGRLADGRCLAVADLDQTSSVDRLAQAADVFVVDLGLDLSLVAASDSPAGDHQPAQLPAKVAGTFAALERLVELERARLESGEHPRRFVLVHSWTVFWDAYVLANLDCSHTTAHSRVRRATVRPVPADDESMRVLLLQEQRLRRWAARGQEGQHGFHLEPRKAVELADASDYSGFGEGWAYPDKAGLWTQGGRSEVAFALEELGEGDHVLALSLGTICVASDATLGVEALVNGKPVASRDFSYGDPDWHVELPAAAVADGVVGLAFEIEDPSSMLDLGWSIDDNRPLGILLRTVELLPADDDAAKAGLAHERRLARWAVRDDGERRLHIRPGQALELARLDDYGGFADGWALEGDAGIWTHGSRSRLALRLDGIGDHDYVIGLSLGSVCVEPEATLRVALRVNDELLVERELSHGDPEWRFELPQTALGNGAAELTFEVDEPRSPAELGWSDDDRRVGILLRELRLSEVDRSVRSGEKVAFTEGSGAERLLGEGWSAVEPTGVWTDGETASLVLKPADGSAEDAELVLAVAAFVTPQHPELTVEVSARGEQLAQRVFRHGASDRLLSVPMPTAAMRGERTVVELRLQSPARPADLGLGDDARRLGVQLRWLMLRKRSWRATLGDVARSASAKVRRRPT
jgi:hypothetical protein